MTKLTRLELKNFLSHKDTTLNLQDYTGLVLIEGKTSDGHYSSNGSGKSTLLEGIVYSLTGNTLRGVGVNDVVNRNYKKDTKVSLEFSRDEDTYTVSRYRKDKTYKDSLLFFKNGEDVTKRVNKDTQTDLDDTLGISYKVLVSTMLLGEGLSSRFTQLSDPEKKSLIESTLNLNYDLNKLRDKANMRLKSLRLDESRLTGEISVLENMQDVDRTSLEDSIHDNEELIKICDDTIQCLQSDYDKLIAEIDSINPKLRMITEALNNYNNLSRQYADLSQSTTHYEGEKQKVINGENPTCALCHQALQSAESRQSVIDNYSSSIEENLKKMRDIEEMMKSLPPKQVLEEKSRSLTAECDEKVNKSRDILRDIGNHKMKITEAQKDIGYSKSTLKDLSDCSEKLKSKTDGRSSISKEIKRYEYFYNLFSPTGIIVDILSEAVDYINTRLSTYSEVLLEKDYKINFVKGKISLVDSKGASYQSLSNGEKRRLDISIQFALHDYVSMYCGMHMDTVFIDEILDTLDDIGVENIFDVLRLKLEYCQLKSIYVITHNNALKDKFDRVITVSKDEKGDSSIL